MQFFAILTGCFLNDALELTGEVITIRKAHVERNLANGIVRQSQLLTGFTQSQADNIINRRCVKSRPKNALEIAGGQMRLCRQIAQADGLCVMVGDVIHDRRKLPYVLAWAIFLIDSRQVNR